MNIRSYVRPGIAAAVMTLASANPAFATQTDVVLNLEGNPTCNSLATNSILEIKDTAPPYVGSKIVMGPDGQKITYTVGANGTTITSWQISSPPSSSLLPRPVNFVILKAKRHAGAREHDGEKEHAGARVFHFGSAGVTSDDTEQGPGRLAQVSFCYGLSPPTPQPLARCSDLAQVGGLDETGINCPYNATEERVLISLDPGSPNWNVKLCTCNANFAKCDPNVAAGQPGACPTGTLTTVPIHIEGVQDPASLICTTIGGQRLCFNR
jgi:hypothetical protein